VRRSTNGLCVSHFTTL